MIFYASCRFGKATEIFSVCFPRKPGGKTFSVQIGTEKVFPYFFRGNGAENVERFRRLCRGKCFFRRHCRGKHVFRIFSAETGRKIVVFSVIIPHTIKINRSGPNPPKYKCQCHKHDLQPESGRKHPLQGWTQLYLHMEDHVCGRSTHTAQVNYQETYLISLDWNKMTD